ncbi:8078_t:CDS:2, partial [Cetraspora pellucida]
DILKLLDDPRDYDMIIIVGEDPDIKTYFVHSNILRVRSDYFKTALSSVVFGENLDPQLIFDCVIAADELAILDLLKYAQRYLLENQITWLKENLALIYLRSFGIESLKDLQDFSLDRIRKYPNLLFGNEDFLSLTDDALQLIIKDDEL